MESNVPTVAAQKAPEGTSKDNTGPVLQQLDLTDQWRHYQDVSEVPWDIQKYVHGAQLENQTLIATRYWQQRHSIFSRYDEGIYMTDDAWFGVTPEPVAK
jgi:trimethylguanosine synthase